MSSNHSPSNQETQVPKETNQGRYFSTASPKAISKLKDELRIMEHALNEVEVNKNEILQNQQCSTKSKKLHKSNQLLLFGLK